MSRILTILPPQPGKDGGVGMGHGGGMEGGLLLASAGPGMYRVHVHRMGTMVCVASGLGSRVPCRRKGWGWSQGGWGLPRAQPSSPWPAGVGQG